MEGSSSFVHMLPPCGVREGEGRYFSAHDAAQLLVTPGGASPSAGSSTQVLTNVSFRTSRARHSILTLKIVMLSSRP